MTRAVVSPHQTVRAVDTRASIPSQMAALATAFPDQGDSLARLREIAYQTSGPVSKAQRADLEAEREAIVGRMRDRADASTDDAIARLERWTLERIDRKEG